MIGRAVLLEAEPVVFPFDRLPRHLRRAAFGLLTRATAGGAGNRLPPDHVAALIAAPDFHPVLEAEAALDALELAR